MAKKPASLLKKIGQITSYALYRSVEGILALIPLTACYRLGQMVGWGVWAFIAPYRKLVKLNLRIAFAEEKDATWIQKTARQHLMSIGGNFFAGLRLPLMKEDEILKRVEFEGYGHVLQVANQGNPVLLAISHMSCWELLTQLPSVFKIQGRPAASIYQALGNPYLNQHIFKRRQQLGYVMFDRKDGFAGPMKLMREQQGALGVLVDQHAGDKGIWMPFFDRLASTSSITALIAIRCKTKIVPVGVYNQGVARWKVVFAPAVSSGESKETVQGLTAALNLQVEALIRRQPYNWFWVHNRWKTPKPDFLLTNYHRGIAYPLNYVPQNLKKFRLLVRSPNWLGDACMAFPAVRALKKGRPDLHLTVFCQSNLEDLWRSLPEVDEVVTKTKKQSLWSVAQKIKEQASYDVAVLLTNSTRSTLELWLAGIPRLVGYKGSLRSLFLHQQVKERKNQTRPEHHADRYLRLAQQCGANIDDARLLNDRSNVGEIIGICAGAEYGQAKRWPIERFAEMAKQVAQDYPGYHFELYGAPGEKVLGENLSGLMQGVDHTNLVGKTSLQELMQHLKRCRLLITNDTGTMHLAAALGVPTVSIFGSTEPVLTGPVGGNHEIVRHHVPCSPCFKRECPLGHYQCMTGITPEIVAAATCKQLQRLA